MKLYTLVMVLALGLSTVVVGEASTTRRLSHNSNHLAKSYKAQLKAAKKSNKNAARAARRGRLNTKIRARRPHA